MNVQPGLQDLLGQQPIGRVVFYIKHRLFVFAQWIESFPYRVYATVSWRENLSLANALASRGEWNPAENLK